MKKLFFISLVLFMGLFMGSCMTPDYVTIDKVYEDLKPPVRLVSSSDPDQYGNVTHRVVDGKGRVYTCMDNSLNHLIRGSYIVKPDYDSNNEILMKMKAPITVIGKAGKYGQELKIKDADGDIANIDDMTLSEYQIGDIIPGGK